MATSILINSPHCFWLLLRRGQDLLRSIENPTIVTVKTMDCFKLKWRLNLLGILHIKRWPPSLICQAVSLTRWDNICWVCYRAGVPEVLVFPSCLSSTLSPVISHAALGAKWSVWNMSISVLNLSRTYRVSPYFDFNLLRELLKQNWFHILARIKWCI